jgi:hypothetical protein
MQYWVINKISIILRVNNLIGFESIAMKVHIQRGAFYLSMEFSRV